VRNFLLFIRLMKLFHLVIWLILTSNCRQLMHGELLMYW